MGRPSFSTFFSLANSWRSAPYPCLMCLERVSFFLRGNVQVQDQTIWGGGYSMQSVRFAELFTRSIYILYIIKKNYSTSSAIPWLFDGLNNVRIRIPCLLLHCLWKSIHPELHDWRVRVKKDEWSWGTHACSSRYSKAWSVIPFNPFPGFMDGFVKGLGTFHIELIHSIWFTLVIRYFSFGQLFIQREREQVKWRDSNYSLFFFRWHPWSRMAA